MNNKVTDAVFSLNNDLRRTEQLTPDYVYIYKENNYVGMIDSIFNITHSLGNVQILLKDELLTLAELAYAADLKSVVRNGHEGSSPSGETL